MRPIAFIFVLGGAAMMLFAGYEALSQLLGVYSQALSDPLADPAVDEKTTSVNMLRALAWGAPGAVFFIIGMIMLKVGVARRLARAAAAARAAREA